MKLSEVKEGEIVIGSERYIRRAREKGREDRSVWGFGR